MAHPIVRAIVQIISGAVLLVIALVVYAAYAEWSGERKAKEFCATVKIGENADALLERAQSSGANERLTRWNKVSIQERWLPVTFTGFTPLSRHTCSVRALENVTSFKYIYLD
jgi:hypothetical protein